MIKISNILNTVSYSVSGITFSNIVPYVFINPTKSTIANIGSTLQVKVKNNLNDNWFLYWKKAGYIFGNYLESGMSTDSILMNWKIPANIDTGKYLMYIFDGTQNFYLYSDTFLIGRNTSINQITEPVNFDVYPNPCEGTLYISYQLVYPSNVEISLFDVVGKFVKTVYRSNLQDGLQKQSIDISGIHEGMYLLQLKTSEGTIKRMIVKE